MTISVNGHAITEESIQFELNRLLEFYADHMTNGRLAEEMERLRVKASEQAVGTLLLRWDAERLDLQVPAEEIEGTIQSMMESAGGENQFKQVLQKQALSLHELRQSIENGKRIDMLVEKITSECVDPRDEEIRACYEANREQYTRPPMVEVSHILLRPDSDSKSDCAVARSRLLEIRHKLEQGADFGELAAAHSECPSGKQSAGRLGWITQGTMVPEFDSTVFRMQNGELSDVVDTTLGMHLIMVTGTKAEGEASLDECYEKVRDLLRHDARGRLISEYVAELKEKAEISDDEP